MRFVSPFGHVFDYEFVAYIGDERCFEAQNELELFLNFIVLNLDLEFSEKRRAWEVSEEEEQFISGAVLGFCYAKNGNLRETVVYAIRRSLSF